MGPSDAQWLYRQGDLILGPVPTQHLIDALYAGTLTPASEVQRLGAGVFEPLQGVPEFKVHLARAQAKHRVEAHAAKHEVQQRRRLVRTAVIVGFVLLVLGVVVAIAGSYLATHRGSAGSAEELAWGDITIDAPTIGKAERRGDDELVDYASTGRPKSPAGQPSAQGPRPTREPTKPRPGTADPDGLEMGEVDEAGINAVVSKHKPSLIPCIKAVVKPGMVAKIPIEFSIGEAGKVTKVWVDNGDFKNTGLQECLLEKLQRWPFKPGTSSASVSISFNVGKQG